MTIPQTEERSGNSRLFEVDSLSEKGPVRDDNQDCARIPEGAELYAPGFLCAVADGMGGYEHGGLASRLAVEALFESYYPANGGARSAQRALEEGMESANLRVLQAAHRLGSVRMGTTLTAVGIRGRRLWIAHAGDSRAYLVRHGAIRCLTEDHTAVGDLVRMNIISKDKVRTHAHRSILTRAVGLGMFLQPDVLSMRLQVGDRMVLCSDGLWSSIEDEEIGSLAAQASTPLDLNHSLLDLALHRETDDNASVVSVFIHAIEDEVREKPGGQSGWLGRLKSWFSPGNKGSQVE